MYLIGIDSSTTATKSLIIDADGEIIAVGAALGAVGITCLVLLVSMTHKFTDLSNRLTAVEVTLKLREKNDGNGEWLQNAVRNLSHELIRAMRHEMRRELRNELSRQVSLQQGGAGFHLSRDLP